MKTEKSDQIIREFLAENAPFQRKTIIFGKEFSGSAETIFGLLCPAREADWISGWKVDLIYTETGGAEPLCVFRTPETNSLGEGIWIMTKLEPNRVVEAVMFQWTNEVLEHLRLDLIDLGNGKTNVTWTVTLTALSEKGNKVIEMVPDETPAFVEGLEYYLTKGELKPQVV